MGIAASVLLVGLGLLALPALIFILIGVLAYHFDMGCGIQPPHRNPTPPEPLP